MLLPEYRSAFSIVIVIVVVIVIGILRRLKADRDRLTEIRTPD